VEINKFVGGFISDASPLTFPENSSITDINMELNVDGSRQRALGIDYEDDYEIINTSISSASSTETAFNSYRWENVGGNPLKVILCVQFGNEVKFFDADNDVLSSEVVNTLSFSSSDRAQRFSFTAVDGKLIIATGINTITIVEYDDGVITSSTDTIKVRDFFGVEDTNGGDDLTVGQYTQKRPTTLSQKHLYNLRNQSFGIPRINNNNDGDGLQDPIDGFYAVASKYPSNSDSVSEYLYADANDSDDRNTRRFFSRDLHKNPLGSSRAAQGYFIIDFLNRGASRLTADSENRENYSELTRDVTSLPTDKTPGGATVVGEFAGRVWYGGFSGEVVGGDSKSPRLSSYLAFSQLVQDPTVITQCYQAGDPTSDNEPDIIDTDGGYIRLNNAYGISSLVNIGDSLIVGASNGIWTISGGSDNGFTATSYIVSKVTDKGVINGGSVVQVEDSLFYWSDDGIYYLHKNEFGDWVSENQTQTRIQKFYNNISIENKMGCIGVYDGFQRKIRWLYSNYMNNISQQKELILDINLSAFYERHISEVTEGAVPIVVSGFRTNVFKVNEVSDGVTVNGVQVTVSGEDVDVTTNIRSSEGSLFEIGYIVVTSLSPTIKYTFAAYTNTDFVDWLSYDDVGVDAPATLVTGYAHGGDTIRYKQVPYLYVHCKRTEDGFITDDNDDLVPINQSSCKVQSMWDWTNSSNAGKWGTAFQAYRYKRAYFPIDVNDEYDTGYETVVTKNKLRGRGRALSLKFTSDPGKEMYIYGWALILSANDNV